VFIIAGQSRSVKPSAKKICTSGEFPHRLRWRGGMRMCDKTYNVLKWMAQLLLPAMGTLYFALASIWRLPYGEQVVGTITAVDTFLGVILGITTAQYKQKQKTDAA
jgi:hypothetical protein